MMKYVPAGVRLSEEDVRALKEASEAWDVSMSGLVRSLLLSVDEDALAAALDKHRTAKRAGKFPEALSLALTREEYARLHELSEKFRYSINEVIRALIKEIDVNNKPPIVPSAFRRRKEKQLDA